MIWRIRRLTFVLLISWISCSTIFGSWTTTTNDLAVTNDSRLLLRASFLGSSQGHRVFKNQADNLHQADMWLFTSRTTTSNGKRISTRRIARKAVRNETKLWPNAEVPFIIAMSMPNNHLVQINQAFETFHQYTCIRFRPRREVDHDFVTVNRVHGCFSYIGRVGGEQVLSLANVCFSSISNVLKMLGQVIGFNNEVSRPDRDEYVTIRLENIRSDLLRKFFEKSTFDMMDTKGIPYDYLSIMHYGPYVYARNGQIVIETKNSSFQSLIGRSTRLSFRDAKLANIMYRCAERRGCDNVTSCPGEGFVGQDCRCWCPSQNSNITAEPCPGLFTTTRDDEITPTKDSTNSLAADWITIRQNDELSLTTRPYHHFNADMITTRQDDETNRITNTTNPPSTSWGTLSLLPIGILVAIVIGCAVTFLAILVVIIFAYQRIKHSARSQVQKSASSAEYCLTEPQSSDHHYSALNREETMCINTEETSMVQQNGMSTEYCSPEHVSVGHTYAVISPQEPLYNEPYSETETPIYCE